LKKAEEEDEKLTPLNDEDEYGEGGGDLVQRDEAKRETTLALGSGKCAANWTEWSKWTECKDCRKVGEYLAFFGENVFDIRDLTPFIITHQGLNQF
jgi:hypothetical protein